tara:strand:+ start:2864 stop:3292 length:429 start_codon:yes stop_codon:yes gene_type:complete
MNNSLNNNYNNLVNIDGIDKDMLLGLLWANANNNYNNNNLQFNILLAKKQIDKNGYADYICGRPIKSQIYNTKEIESFYYNRDNGENKMEEIIEYIKNNKLNISKLNTVESENYKLQEKSSLKNFIDPLVMEDANNLYKQFF